MYQIKSIVHLDRFNKCYKNIITISPKPNNAILNSIIKPLQREKLSPFQETNSPCCPLDNCIYAFTYPNNTCELLCVDDIAILFAFFASNGFTVNTDITKIMQKSDVKLAKLICFITT